MPKNKIPICFSENSIFDFDLDCFRVKGIIFFLLGIKKDDFPLRFIKPHMVEGSPSGLYTTVFSVLCYCAESYVIVQSLQRVARCKLVERLFSAKAFPTITHDRKDTRIEP